MTETYNPRDHSFIRKPEPKCCITCGQPLPSDVKPFTNHMNLYLNIISGKTVGFNSNEETISVQGVTLYRVDLDEKNQPVNPPKSKFVPVPKGTTATPQTNVPKPTTSPILTQIPK